MQEKLHKFFKNAGKFSLDAEWTVKQGISGEKWENDASTGKLSSWKKGGFAAQMGAGKTAESLRQQEK